jgi:type II secretory pathway pseudopilin PulG
MSIKYKMRLFKIKKGDTLVEVLFSLIIISAIIAVAINGALNASRNSRSARERTQAQFLVDYQVEALRAYKDSRIWQDFFGDIDKCFGEPNLAYKPINKVINSAPVTGSVCHMTIVDSSGGKQWGIKDGIKKSDQLTFMNSYFYVNKSLSTFKNGTFNASDGLVTITVETIWYNANGQYNKAAQTITLVETTR